MSVSRQAYALPLPIPRDAILPSRISSGRLGSCALPRSIVARALLRSCDYSKVQIAEDIQVSRHTL